MLKRFGSVTVLNGHIHQVVQKVEGNVAFHTAMATAFPQPAPGAAPNPGPMVVPAGKLQSVLGVTNVKVVRGHSHLAVVDHSLAEGAVKRVGAIVLLSAVALVASAFIHPFGDPRVEPAKGLDTLLRDAKMPADAKQVLVAKCADCHSRRDALAGLCAAGSGVVADRAGHCEGPQRR